jgi:predicted metalloendopeptidase
MHSDTDRLYKLAHNLDNTKISDIYEYVNKDWINSTQHDNAFDEIQKTVDERIKDIIKNDNGIIRIIHDRIKSNYDNDGKFDKQYMGDFPDLINLIHNAHTLSDLGNAVGALEVHLANTLFSSFANQDPKNVSITKYTIMSPNMILPHKQMYVLDEYAGIQDTFIEHADEIANIYNGLVDKGNMIDTTNFGESVYNVSFFMSYFSGFSHSIDDMYSRMTPISFVNAIKMCSSNVHIFDEFVFDNDVDCETVAMFWSNYFDFINDRGALYEKNVCKNDGECSNIIDEIIVYNLSYFQGLSSILKYVPLRFIKNYLIYRTIIEYCETTITAFDKSIDKLDEALHTGNYETIEERILDRTNAILKTKPLGYVVENAYIQRYGATQDTITDIMRVIEEIKKELKQCINNSNIFGDSTKSEAYNKLLSMTAKIGHPSSTSVLATTKHKDMINEMKHRSEIMLNMLMHLTTQSFETEFIDRIIKNSPINEKNRWNMMIYEPNAYYDPRVNGFAIPIGILNYPICDVSMSHAEKYAGLGMIIAHEMTHGFDNRGKKYDSQGNLRKWWKNNDETLYKDYSKKIVDQFNDYGVNGFMTLGENISDLVGVNLAYRAFVNNTNPNIYDKRVFFMAYARLWRSSVSNKKEEIKHLSDPHAPAKYRVWQIINMDEFYEVIPLENSEMFLDNKERIKPFEL